MILSTIIILFSAILIALYLITKNKKGLKNFTVNIALIILTGIISMFFIMAMRFAENSKIEPESVIFTGEFTIFMTIFFNFCGYAFSIKNINKIHITIICHVLFIISSLIISCVIVTLVDSLYETSSSELEFPLVMCFVPAILAENLSSYLIARKLRNC